MATPLSMKKSAGKTSGPLNAGYSCRRCSAFSGKAPSSETEGALFLILLPIVHKTNNTLSVQH
ncbi:hypothetical protein [Aneurinibacillus danicus]|uniref:hypothetical protein n=1 Tax=Aneurinibacillus danicus TaxID=267746 RepID=UPI0011BDDE31|nr:hypothetical protein [Aneurinibacillus danicus]